MGDFVKRVAALSPEQLSVLKSRLRPNGGSDVRTQIPRRPRDRDLFPLSFAQERLWFLDQLHRGSPMYNIATSYRFQGPLNIEALEQSLDEIVRRHEVLRTTFTATDGQPSQQVLPPRPLAPARVDLREMPAAARELETQRLMWEESAAPFDLSRDLLVRATLLELDDADHVLLLTMHHIVSDGWSLGVFARELTALYDAFSAGRPSPLPELPIQYADFAQWQRETLQGPLLERHIAYWKRQLAGAPALAALPADRPRPAVQSFRGAVQPFFIALPVLEELKALGRRQAATLFMTLLAAFTTLLYRYSAQEDQVVGTLIAGRNRMEIEGLIGFFVNALALRTDLSGNPTFRELLGRVAEVTLEAYAHQDLPFEKLVEELHPERNLSHHPLFQVLFALQNTPASLDEAAAPSDAPQLGSGTAKFDLSLFMAEMTNGLLCSFEYNTDLFDAATVYRMAEHLIALLDGIAADPDRRILEIPLAHGGEGSDAEPAPELAETFLDDKFAFELAQPRPTS
ncbi:MAG: Non-ribosomal peptide synthetase component [Candidatus Eremiobacteraeota bacterium]|nr:Non-ribosomal peptide synthetase component [Candidatus Eremiobacteraeota bacterium]